MWHVGYWLTAYWHGSYWPKFGATPRVLKMPLTTLGLEPSRTTEEACG